MVEFWTKKSVWVNLTSGATFHFSSSAKIEIGKSQVRFLFFTNLSCLSHKSLGFSRPHFDLEMGSDALARAFVNPWLAAEKYKVEYVNALNAMNKDIMTTDRISTGLSKRGRRPRNVYFCNFNPAAS